MNFSETLYKALQNAGELATRMGYAEIASEHLLFGIISIEDSPSSQILKKFGITKQSYLQAVDERMEKFPSKYLDEVGYTTFVREVLIFAQKLASKMQLNKTNTEHVLVALVQNAESDAMQLLRRAFNIDLNTLRNQIYQHILPTAGGEQTGSNVQSGEGSTLPKSLLELGTDLTLKAKQGKIDPIIGRNDEIARIIEILCRKTKNNPVLIGEAGVGKSAVVEGLAKAIVEGNVPDLLKGKTIFSLELGSLMAGTKYRGSMEEKLKNAIDTITQNKDIIVFIDELHTLVQAGGGGDKGEVSPSDMLKPYLARGEMQTIGATTTEEYRKFIEQDKALERRFQPIVVNPPSVEQTIEILRGLRESYEQFHKVKITDEAINAAATLSDRYIMDRSLPDKAIDLIDEASSRAKVSGATMPAPLKELHDRLERLESEKKDAVARQDYTLAGNIHDEIKSLAVEYQEQKQAFEESIATGPVIGFDDIARVVSAWSHVPVTKLTETERERLMNLEELLHNRVIGQDQAVVAVSKAIRRARAGLKDPNRPIGSFLFLGPTGVGKTELSKALAEAMFDDDNLIIRLDMSEFMESHSVSKLIGSPPGYVGHDDGGQLTEQVRRKPYSIILFDELEKAHPDVFNILLQILDDGRLTDSHGRTVSFKNTIIIMTSNAGVNNPKYKQNRAVYEKEEDLDTIAKLDEEATEILNEAIKGQFRPEFLNRIDSIVIFKSLSKPELAHIAKLLITRVVKKLKEQEIELKFTEDALKYLVQKGYTADYGARPLRRVIEQEIEDKLADEILSGKLANGAKVTVDADIEIGKLKFRIYQPKNNVDEQE